MLSRIFSRSMPNQPHKLKTTRTLWPGKPGTKKFVTQYGQHLVCVRHRYDGATLMRHTTVEVIVDTVSVVPGARRIPHNKIMFLRVQYGEVEVGKAIKAAGGSWNAQKKLWELAYKQVKALNLTDRIVEEV